MVRLIFALVLVLLIAPPSLGQQPLVGTYKLVSHVVEIGGTLSEPLGKAPHGYLVFTPTRAIAFFTAENRKFGPSAADKAALLDTLSAWSGTYRIEEDKIIVAVDASWTEVWNGTDLVRHWSLSGNRLTLVTDPGVFPRDPSKTAVGRQLSEKLE